MTFTEINIVQIMFTLEQIKAAHAKVESGADFPRYIDELKKMGIAGYDTFVSDGHTLFSGLDGTGIASEAKYETQQLSAVPNSEHFTKELKNHQQGKSSYLDFCSMAAGTGVEKWVVDMEQMTCTYLDVKGSIILVETIPSV
jgi:uncharacterized protein YbcV (DUF1398 family)